MPQALSSLSVTVSDSAGASPLGYLSEQERESSSWLSVSVKMLILLLRHFNPDKSKIWTSILASMTRISYSLLLQTSVVGHHTLHCFVSLQERTSLRCCLGVELKYLKPFAPAG